MRARLLEQFNRVLPTTDTPRGLVVNMGDVLFDAGKFDLRPEAREDLAKLSGIVLNYPSLALDYRGSQRQQRETPKSTRPFPSSVPTPCATTWSSKD